MSKKAIIEQINALSMLQRHAINDRREFGASFLGNLKRGEISAYGFAVAILASDLGIASRTWDRPAELRAAA
jgi:hypothetical protein